MVSVKMLINKREEGKVHYLSWMSRAAVKQGRSSSKWKISMAVPASSRNGRRSTNSEIRGGLFHARNCKE